MWQKIKAFFKSLFAKEAAAPEPVVVTPPSVQPTQPTQPGLQAALSWELPCNDSQLYQKARPECRAWSEALFKEIEAKYDLIISANDITTVLPDLNKLTKDQRITKLCEMMCGVAKYECDWNQAAVSKDVNGSDDEDDQATGLYQLNLGDQEWYRTGTNFTHKELLDPINNIKAGVGILAYLVQKRGQITFAKGQRGSPSAFFQTLMFGVKNTDEHVGIILKMVADMKFDTKSVNLKGEP